MKKGEKGKKRDVRRHIANLRNERKKENLKEKKENTFKRKKERKKDWK